MKRNLIFILLIVTLFSCEKTEEYSEIPHIEFLEFRVEPGDEGYTIANGIISFSFIDGDGNIGFPENYDSDTTNNQTDFVYKEYYKQNGSFIEKTGDTYFLPYFEEGIYRKSLKGTIDIYLPITILSHDTVYYEFYILDRDSNQSNIEVTPEIIYSEMLKQL